MTLLTIIVVGLILGSFLNVCIYRIPRGESIIYPPSHCPICNKQIKPYDNVPLISYLILKGRCRFCKAKISWRYPLVEILNAGLFIGLYFKYGLTIAAVKNAFFVMLLLIASFIDLEHQIIPNVVSLPGIILGLVLNYNHDEYFITIFGGAIISAAILWLFRWGGMVFKKKEMMGLGDVKLAGMIGAFLGSGKSLVALFFGVLLGIMIWSILMAFKLKSRRDYIPFGFFLGLGALVALFWGQEIINWYWGLFTITP